jgi:hypothetical protein
MTIVSKLDDCSVHVHAPSSRAGRSGASRRSTTARRGVDGDGRRAIAPRDAEPAHCRWQEHPDRDEHGWSVSLVNSLVVAS